MKAFQVIILFKLIFAVTAEQNSTSSRKVLKSFKVRDLTFLICVNFRSKRQVD